MIQKSAILNFPKSLIERPVISRVIREFDVEVNILKAHITPENDGHMFAIFSGDKNVVDAALDSLRQREVRIVLPRQNLVWHESACVHCTACVGQCPSAAFSVDPETFEVAFDAKRCIACKLCIPACAFKALESVSEHLTP